MWEGENTDQEVGFLKPHGTIPLRWLAIMRTLIAIYFIGHTSLILYFVYETFILYLTNWSLVSCTVLYPLMAIAHMANKDFKKETYVEVERPLRKKCPVTMWKTITTLYEFTLSM